MTILKTLAVLLGMFFQWPWYNIREILGGSYIVDMRKSLVWLAALLQLIAVMLIIAGWLGWLTSWVGWLIGVCILYIFLSICRWTAEWMEDEETYY